MGNLMPIGRFSRSCRLTVKALRLYDEIGLLPPAFVDPATGYRYYARDQARTAITIGLLRSLDVPLAAIREVLASDPATAERVLDRERRRIAAELAQKQHALRSIERIIRTGEVMPYDVAVREEPARTVLMVGGSATPERDVEETHALVARLLECAQRLDRPWREPIMCVLPATHEDMITLQVCVAIDGAVGTRAERAVAPAVIDEMPGGTVAYVTHVGPYEELGLAHHSLSAWAQERGHDPIGPVREAYIDDPAEVDAAELRTEIILPIRTTTT